MREVGGGRGLGDRESPCPGSSASPPSAEDPGPLGSSSGGDVVGTRVRGPGTQASPTNQGFIVLTISGSLNH